MSRFKPAAERVLKEKRNADAQKSKREAPEKPRRTSIPKLKDRTIVKKNPPTDEDHSDKTESKAVTEAKDERPVKTNLKRATRKDRIPVMSKDHYKITKKDDGVKKDEPVKTKASEKLDDEFDKLYDEIVDNDAASIPEEILEIKVKDPEKLEIRFEEIVHQYDDPPIEQVKLEPIDKARYSKIPLLRRRSSHDVKLPGQLERRLSLKTGTINKSTPGGDQETNNSTVKKKDIDKANNVTQINRAQVSDNTDSEIAVEENNNDENNEDHYLGTESPPLIPDYNTSATPDSELVKVGIFGISPRNIPLDETNQIVTTPELETVKVAVIDTPAEEPPKQNSEDIHLIETKPTYSPEVQHDTYILAIDNKHEIVDNVYLSEENNTDVPNNSTEETYLKDEKDTTKVAISKDDPVDHNKINRIVYPDNDLKSYNLLKNTTNIEERTKSRYINKPPNKETKPNNVATIEEDIPKGKVSRILKRLTSQENPNTEHTEKYNDTEVIDAKKETDNISKKKSLLSKIAMFERRDPDPPKPKTLTHKYSKPVRTISEDVKHSPKIVQEVLKPRGVQPDKHTIVTVDIVRPVEVISHNKEEVPVVENLKEIIVTYDNFDDSRLNKTENKIVHDVLPPKGVLTNEHTFVTIDVMKPVEVVTNNAEQVTVVENFKENTVTYDNFDHDRLNNIEPTEIEPKSLNIVNNDTVLTDISGNDDNIDNYNKSERSDNLNTIIVKENKPKGLFLKDDDNNEPAPINEIRPNNNYSKEKWKSTDALTDFLPVKEKINRLKSYEDTNMKKAKSTAELDLGDAVKGKVKKMIVRMNSSELLDDVRPKEVEVISAKERPRKRSVSEKIALFERKLTPVTMDDVKLKHNGRALNPHTKPVKDTVNAVPVNTKPVKDAVNATNGMQIETDIDYAAKIKELNNAKLTYGSVSDMSYIQLRDGRKMPVIALGTALLDSKLATHIVAAAIDLGYRAIDTAFIYGNEKEVGEGIRAKILDGTVRRDDLFIMNKMWSTFHRPDLVEGACRASLAATGLDYFDLYMIHNPMSFKEGGDPLPKIANVLQFSDYDYLDAWFAMESLVSKGLVRSIGVSNFNSVQLDRVLDKGRIKPVVNQVECHPYLSQQRLSDFCEARGVRLSCFGVLGSKGTPADLKASQAAAIDDPLLQVMAAGLGITAAQLLIRYQIDSGHGVVVKASSGAHLRDDLRALRAALQPPQLAAIHALNKNKRTFTFVGMGDTHKNYPFKIAF